MTWDRWIALVMGTLVLLGGIGFVVGPNDSAQLHTCIAVGKIEEGSGQFDSGGSLWPPGKRCRFYQPDGSTTTVVKPASTKALLFVLVLVLMASATPLAVGALARSWWARATA